jgi:Ca2+-binding RTX toxin-like protein
MLDFIKHVGRQHVRRASFRPGLEALEDRLALSPYTVTGTNDPDRFTITYHPDAMKGSWFSVKREAEYLRSGGFENSFDAPRGASVQIDGLGGDDVVYLYLPPVVPAGMEVTILGGEGNDSVQDRRSDGWPPAYWLITGPVDANVNGYARLFGVEALIGKPYPVDGDGFPLSPEEIHSLNQDTFELAPGVAFAGRIDGGGMPGATLSYRDWTTGVKVDLRAASRMATGIAGGIKGIDNVTGGAGNDSIWGTARNNILRGNAGIDVIHAGDGADIVLGGSGDDGLYGGLGLDLIVGGLGADDLYGGDGHDILIGGSTVYDLDDALLLNILDDWQDYAPENNNFAFATRIQALRADLQSTTVLPDTFVKGSGYTDRLFGQGDLDWFWADPAAVKQTAWAIDWFKGDIIGDLASGEVVR